MPLSDFQLSEGRYNARDVLATVRLYKPLVADLQRFGAVNVYLHDREMAKLALQMRRQGMPIDDVERKRVGDHLREIRDSGIEELRKYTLDEAFPQWIAEFQAAKVRLTDPKVGEINDLNQLVYSSESAFASRVVRRRMELDKKWARKRTKGIDPVQLTSKTQAAAILKVAGVPLVMLSKNGTPKIGKDVLEGQAANPAARAMLNYQITKSIITTFCDNLPVVDGWIHPDWLIHKITGRWGSEPNVQNWSVRAGGGAENLRRMVRAPNGYIFVGADFAQLEARILACLSRDSLLLAIFGDPSREIHAEMAAVGFPQQWPKLDATYKLHNHGEGCNDCKSRKKLRDLTKRLEYGGFYGGAPDVLWRSVVKDWPQLMLRDIENFVRNMNIKMPGVMRWRAQVLKDVTAAREVRSPFLGRRQTFPLGRVDPGVAYNYKAQSGGADLWCLGALDFMKRWPQTIGESGANGRIIHNGHDSVLVLAREKDAEKVAVDVRESWERTIDGVPFLMDVKIGERWSDV